MTETEPDLGGCAIFLGLIITSISVGVIDTASQGWLTFGAGLVIIPLVVRVLRKWPKS